MSPLSMPSGARSLASAVRCVSFYVLPLILGATLAACSAEPADEEESSAQTMPPREAAPAPLEGRTMSVDGVEVAFDSRGSGSPALVFIHCWSCDRGYWDGQVDFFAENHQVIALDLPGHGDSGTDRREWTIAAFGEDVQAVVEALKLDRVVLIGHSMGGKVALEAARLLPEQVATVVGVDTLHNAEWSLSPEDTDQFLAPFEADFPAGVRAFVSGLFPQGTDPALVERIAADMGQATPEVAVALLRDLFSEDLTEPFSQIDVPLFSIFGEVGAEGIRMEINRRHAPQFDGIVMEGVGHFPQIENPEEFNRLLSKTLDSLVPVAPGG